jgi:hypothetical protein
MLDLGILEIAGTDDPGSTLAVLGSRQDFLLDEPADRCFADIQPSGCFFHRGLAALGALPVTIRRDPAMIAQKAAPRTGPAVATPSGLSSAVEDWRNCFVGQLPGERGDEFDHVAIRSPAMLAGAVLTHAQRGVVAARSSNNESECVVLDPHNDLLDQRPDDPLAGGRRRSRAVPGGLDISAEGEQVSSLSLGERRLCHCNQPILLLFERTDGEQALIPALLQLGGDQTVIRIDGVVLPSGPSGLVAGLSIASST